jgi:hypothetical protein
MYIHEDGFAVMFARSALRMSAGNYGEYIIPMVSATPVCGHVRRRHLSVDS